MITAKSVQQIVEENTIEQLLKLPQDIEVAPSEVKDVTDNLWTKYKDYITALRKEENTEEVYLVKISTSTDQEPSIMVRTLSFNGKLMRFTVVKQGDRPENGYPLVIALHGGGQSQDEIANNTDWLHVQSIWKNDVNPGIYVAVRGISDTWNTHFMDESYPLYDRLIENLVAFEDVDPNKVFLLGFSAGGDGVYQIAARMADRLGAANMMAGHPGDVSVVNYRNIAFLIQMGEQDNSYDRNIWAAKYGKKLDDQQQIPYPSGLPSDQQEALNGYIHDVFIHPFPFRSSDPKANPHNDWIDSTLASNPQPNPVINDLKAWLSTSHDQTTVNKNTASVPWLTKYPRVPYPDRVIWDTKTRADTRRGVAPNKYWFFRNQDRAYQFYWLDIGRNIEKFSPTVYARYYAAPRNEILVANPGEHLGLLLHTNMLDLTKPVYITVGDDRLVFQPKLTLKSLVRTLVSRGDRSFTFPARIDLEKDGAFYTAVGGSTLRLSKPVGDNNSGESFLDLPPENARLTSVVVRSGDVVDAVQATYGSAGALPMHGGPGGGPHEVNLAEDECITQVSGQYGNYFGLTRIAQITIRTNKNNSSTFGSTQFTSDLQSFIFTAQPDEEIAAFYGRAGTQYLTALGVGYRKVGTRPVVEVAGEVIGGSEFSGTGTADEATPGVTVFTATVAETRPIAGVTVWVNLQHGGGGGLLIEVISPAGTPVVLSGQQGGDHLDTTFDDTATTPIGSGSGQFKPEEPLSALIGESAAGTWRLRIVDATGTSTGTLPLLGWKVFVQPA